MVVQILNLNDRKWKEFDIGGDNGIFKIKSSVSGIDGNKLLPGEGNIPYLTRTYDFNGIKSFITDKQNRKYSMDTNNVITIGLDTQTVFYQPHRFYTGQNMQVLKNTNLTKNIALFMIPLLKIQMQKFNWGGNGATLGRLSRTKIMLPINDKDEPDYEFMECYGVEQETFNKLKYVKYSKKELKELDCLSTDFLNSKEWKEFRIGDIFNISPGKRLTKKNMQVGNIPFIGATDSGNGITNYISNTSDSLDKNVLGVNYNGNGVAIGFYHQYECLFTDDVKRFHLKNHKDNKYVCLFLKTLILQQKPKYNYGYKFNEQRMLRQYIMLPVDDNGEPDYYYMENYIKEIMKKKYKEYLKYTD